MSSDAGDVAADADARVRTAGGALHTSGPGGATSQLSVPGDEGNAVDADSRAGWSLPSLPVLYAPKLLAGLTVLLAYGMLTLEVRDKNKVSLDKLKMDDVDVLLSKESVMDNGGLPYDRLSILNDNNWKFLIWQKSTQLLNTLGKLNNHFK